MPDKTIFNKYTTFNEDGTKLLDEFTDILDDKIKDLVSEGYSRADIFYTILSAADYILVTESVTCATKMRIKEREDARHCNV